MADLTAQLDLGIDQALRDVARLDARLDQAVSGFGSAFRSEMSRIRDQQVAIRVDDDEIIELRRRIQQLEDEVKDLDDEAKRTSKSFGALGSAIKGALVGIGIGGALRGLKALVDAASDVEESTSKAATVFGDSFDTVAEAAEDSATATGLATQEFLEAAGTLGNLFTAQGIAADEAARLSTSIVQLGADIASFNNLEVDEALVALRSGLVGETEPLRRVGIVLNAAAVEAKALELGLADASGEVSEAAKVQARYALITEQAATQTGDFARTADGLANSQRTLQAEFKDAAATIGVELLPLAKDLVDVASTDLVPTMVDLGRAVLPLLVEGFDALSPVLGTTTDILRAAAPALQVVADVVEAIPDPLLQFAAAAAIAGKAFAALQAASSARTVSESLRGLVTSARSAGGSVSGLGSTLRANLGTIGVGAAVAGLVLIQGELDAARREAAELNDELFRGLQAPTSVTSEQSFDDLQAAVATARSEVQALRDIEVDSSLGDQFRRTFELLPGVDADRLLDREQLNDAEQRLENLENRLLDSSRNIAEASRQIEDALGFDLDRGQITALADEFGIDLSGAMDVVVPKLVDAARESDALAGSLNDVSNEGDDAAASLDDYLGAVNDIIGVQLDAESANLSFLDSLDDLTEAVEESKGSFDPLNETSREARQTFIDAAEAALSVASAQAEVGASVDEVSSTLSDNIDELKDQARQAGATEAQVDELVRTLELFPDEIAVRLTADATLFTSELSEASQQIDRLREQGFRVGDRSRPGIGGLLAADGMIVTQPTPIIAGEAGAEVVVPLTRPQRARELVAASGLLDVIGSGRSEPVPSQTQVSNEFNIAEIRPNNFDEFVSEMDRRRRLAMMRSGVFK